MFATIFCSSLIYSSDDFELKSESRYEFHRINRFSFLFNLNPSLTKGKDLTQFMSEYGLKLDDLRSLDFSIQYTKGLFHKMSINNGAATLRSDDEINASTSNSELMGTVGLSFISHYFNDLFNLDSANGLYEIMGAGIGLTSYKNSLLSDSYFGPGITAKFSLLKSINDNIAVGGNFIYNLSSVKRAQKVSSETSSSRSLTLTHLTMGIDFTFYL